MLEVVNDELLVLLDILRLVFSLREGEVHSTPHSLLQGIVREPNTIQKCVHFLVRRDLIAHGLKPLEEARSKVGHNFLGRDHGTGRTDHQVVVESTCLGDCAVLNPCFMLFDIAKVRCKIKHDGTNGLWFGKEVHHVVTHDAHRVLICIAHSCTLGRRRSHEMTEVDGLAGGTNVTYARITLVPAVAVLPETHTVI